MKKQRVIAKACVEAVQRADETDTPSTIIGGARRTKFIGFLLL
jgi:hypothetical protein